MKLVTYHLTKHEHLTAILNRTFRSIEDIADVSQMTNAQLRTIIQRIEVDKDGNVDIFLRLTEELGIDCSVAVKDDLNTDEIAPVPETAPLVNDRANGRVFIFPPLYAFFENFSAPARIFSPRTFPPLPRGKYQLIKAGL